jgi:sugar-specific transcriptional regulator TrmB
MKRDERLTLEDHDVIGAALRNFRATALASSSNRQGQDIKRRRIALDRVLAELQRALDNEMRKYCKRIGDRDDPYCGNAGDVFAAADLTILATPDHVQEVRERFNDEVANKLNKRVSTKVINLGIKVSNKFLSLKLALIDRETQRARAA